MSTRTIRLKDDQNVWNLIFSALYALLLILSLWYFYAVYHLTPRYMSVWDFLLISLAIFRITRLVVYDKITQFLRDAFMRSRELVGDDGETYIERIPYRGGFMRTISDLLACPWCTGMWAALVVVFAYYATPFAMYPILLLAVSAVGNVMQLAANTIGWRAENLKLDVAAKTEGTVKPDGN